MRVLISLCLVLAALIEFGVTQPRRNCGTVAYNKQLEKQFPQFRRKRLNMDTHIVPEHIRSFSNARQTVYRIPVVVHVVYHTKEQNISDERVFSQIRVLNEDYRRLNGDRIHTPKQFQHLASDARIEFVLANTDPYGRPTSGITRTYTEKGAFISFENDVKTKKEQGVDPWPTDKYLNIWVCNLSMGVLGYSQFPGGPKETDGVVISYRFFGKGAGVRAPFNLGRTTTHEVGHYLNLRHIWGDGGCGVDDYVEDTPMAEYPTHGCVANRTTCGSEDMVSNFMDYTDDACMNLFTRGQAARMRALFAPGGLRASLIRSQGYQVPLAMEGPQWLNVESLNEKDAKLSWASVKNATGYELQIRKRNDARWRTFTYRENDRIFKNLPSCEKFEFKVAALYVGGKKSKYSSNKSFETGGCVIEPPKKPQGFFATHVQGNTANISWRTVPGVDFYILQYKESGSRKVLSKRIYGDNATSLAGLKAGTLYAYRLGLVYSEQRKIKYSNAKYFRTGSSYARSNNDVSFVQVTRANDPHDLVVRLAEVDTRPVNIALKDENGQIIYESKNQRLAAQNGFHLNTRSLQKGNYRIEIKDNDGFLHEKSIQIRP